MKHDKSSKGLFLQRISQSERQGNFIRKKGLNTNTADSRNKAHFITTVASQHTAFLHSYTDPHDDHFSGQRGFNTFEKDDIQRTQHVRCVSTAQVNLDSAGYSGMDQKI